MGLLDQVDILNEEEQRCKTALVLDGFTALPNGSVIDDTDRERLTEARAQGMGAPILTGLLRKLGFDVGQANVGDHLAGRCMCTANSTLLGDC